MITVITSARPGVLGTQLITLIGHSLSYVHTGLEDTWKLCTVFTQKAVESVHSVFVTASCSEGVGTSLAPVTGAGWRNDQFTVTYCTEWKLITAQHFALGITAPHCALGITAPYNRVMIGSHQSQKFWLHGWPQVGGTALIFQL